MTVLSFRRQSSTVDSCKEQRWSWLETSELVRTEMKLVGGRWTGTRDCVDRPSNRHTGSAKIFIYKTDRLHRESKSWMEMKIWLRRSSSGWKLWTNNQHFRHLHRNYNNHQMSIGCGLVWSGVMWCGLIWSGVVWCNICYDHTGDHSYWRGWGLSSKRRSM